MTTAMQVVNNLRVVILEWHFPIRRGQIFSVSIFARQLHIGQYLPNASQTFVHGGHIANISLTLIHSDRLQ